MQRVEEALAPRLSRKSVTNVLMSFTLAVENFSLYVKLRDLLKPVQRV